MTWELVVVLVVVIPVILFPAAYIWYINVGGMVAMFKEARARRAAHKKEIHKPVKAANG